MQRKEKEALNVLQADVTFMINHGSKNNDTTYNCYPIKEISNLRKYLIKSLLKYYESSLIRFLICDLSRCFFHGCQYLVTMLVFQSNCVSQRIPYKRIILKIEQVGSHAKQYYYSYIGSYLKAEIAIADIWNNILCFTAVVKPHLQLEVSINIHSLFIYSTNCAQNCCRQFLL